MAAVHPSVMSKEPAPTLWEGIRSRLTRVFLGFSYVFVGDSNRRYTVSKFLALHAHAERCSRWRIAAIILLYPLPALVVAVIIAILPLQDPALGVTKNWGFIFQSSMGVFVVGVGSLSMALSSVNMLHTVVSTRQVAVISALASLQYVVEYYALASYWRFPVPFVVVVLLVPWGLGLALSSMLVLGSRLTGSDATLRSAIATSTPAVVLQVAQLILYPALSILFEGVLEWQQVLLTLALPMIRRMVKWSLRRVGHQLGEFSEEVAVSGVEIAASMYQTTLMQNTLTVPTTAVIIGVDVLQGLLMIRLFMDKTTSSTGVQQREITGRALELLSEHAVTPADLLERDTSRPGLSSVSVVPGSLNGKTKDVVIVHQALEIAQIAENILLTEYCEVMLPVINGLYLVLVSPHRSTRFNPTLCQFHYNPSRLPHALQNLVIYSSLQGLTVVLMMVVMRKRYRLSSVSHLAFVLERHVWSVQGKLLVWLPIFFYFSVVHFGVDFEFNRCSCRERKWRMPRVHALSGPPESLRPWLAGARSALRRHPHRRYTVSKFMALHAYAQRTTAWRLAAVLVLYPLPCLSLAVASGLIPLQEPALGIARNWGFLVQSTLGCFVVGVGTMIMAFASVQVLHSAVAMREVVAIGVLTALQVSAAHYLLASRWRFPVPFMMAVMVWPECVSLVLASVLVLRRRLIGPDPSLRKAIGLSVPPVFLQVTQVIVYPALTALFKGVSEWQQLLLTLALPMLKFVVKKALRRAARFLGEFSEEVAVSGVEIAACMYQTTLMQNSPTFLTTAVIIGVDVAHGLLLVRLFMDKSGAGAAPQRRELFAQAVQLVSSGQVTEADLVGRRPTARPSQRSIAVLPNQPKQKSDNVRVVLHALEIAQAAESILLTEYCEVALPVVNGVFLWLVSPLHSSRFNPTVCAYYYEPARLHRVLRNLALYSALQGLTVGMMVLVMRKRYRLSPLAHLSFVLERHVWSLQGKLLVWLSVFFYFPTVHYGTDFEFKFDFEKILHESC
ncbi:hypothetical protein ATCC90586_001232 [Pythium insidiosum]|nr:hypothetical protein ATCC90586_001232 [Pythium insidiosum]